MESCEWQHVRGRSCRSGYSAAQMPSLSRRSPSGPLGMVVFHLPDLAALWTYWFHGGEKIFGPVSIAGDVQAVAFEPF